MNKLVLSICTTSLLLTSAIANTELEEILVSAKVNSEVIDTAGSFNILTQEDIKTSNASNIQDILEETVGINVTSNNRSINGRKNITFRGMNPEHTAILINGKRISNTDAQIGHSDFQYNWLPLSAISKIEIVRGPMSSLYGSKALGGVVNIITKKPNEKFEGAVDLKYSTTKDDIQAKNLSVNLSGQVNDKLSLNLFAEKSTLDDTPNKKNSNKPSEFEGKDITNLMVDAWYTIDDSQEISASYIKGKELRNAVSFDLFESIGAKETNNYFEKLYQVDKEHYSLAYNKFFDFGLLSLKGYRSTTDSHSDSFRYTHELKDDVLNAEVTLENIDNHYIVLGTDFRKESYKKRLDSDGITLPRIGSKRKGFENDISYKSLYIQDEIEASDKLLITLGARYDKHEKFSGEFSPKIFGVYKLSENQRLKAGYGRGFNAPTLTQLSDDYSFSNPNAGHAFKGNSNLKPEISDTYELGYEFNDDVNILKTTAFYTKVKDLISEKQTNESAGGGLKYEIYSNINSSEIKGLELEYLRDNILNNLDLAFSYTYLDTKDKEKNRELNFRPKHKINTSFKYYFDKTLFANLSLTYTGEQKNYDDINKEYTKMDGYFTSKVQVSKEFSKNLNIRVGIDNLTDEELAENFNYQLKPRTFYTNLTYKF